MKWLIASNNSHKIQEFKTLLQDHEIQSLGDLAVIDEIEETGETLHENALLKASYLASRFPEHYILSDDSGLEVDALQGAPGVYSARFAGLPVDPEKNISLLLHQLEDVNNRNACFKTVICLISPQQSPVFFIGEIKGEITHERRGQSGFGYDPVFLPLGSELTFAEMSPSEKNKISHRSRAIQKLQSYLPLLQV